MSVEYKVVKIIPPGKKEEDCNPYYPRITKRVKRDLRDLAEDISKISTFSTIDVIGVLEAFTSLIPNYLKDNCSVELGDLGTFSLHINAEGSESPEKVSRHNVKGVKMAFRPSPRVKKDLQTTTFKKLPTKK
ncbi:HU family DNA-binding protein [Marinifilum flexuosum]|uniref:HU family DNA-binding protein n=1 Tax=Marinifilum flexuosum TaxID=1117708 RepID=UPI0024910C3A|nr:HU family DNA-binding protein [Marinifilum flexuosum]